MATTALLPLLLLSLLAAAASARPCKTFFYFSATTTAYYPYHSLTRNPNPNTATQNPRYLTLIFTSTASPFSDRRRPFIHFESDPAASDSRSSPIMTTSSDFPVKFYSSVSTSIRERTKDILSVVGALLFGVGCGALTAAVMYFVWAMCYPTRFDFGDISSDDEDDGADDEVAAAKKRLGYLAIPTKPFDDDLKKPAPPAKEVIYSEEDMKFNKDINIGLIQSELLNLAEYSVHTTKLLDAGRNSATSSAEKRKRGPTMGRGLTKAFGGSAWKKLKIEVDPTIGKPREETRLQS